MTFQHFASLAAACTNMVDLERLFIDERKFIDDPDWRFVKIWRDNKERIEGDGETGEVLEDYPF